MKQKVTGLNVTHGVKVPKVNRKNILTHLHYCNEFGVKKHLANRKRKGKPYSNNAGFQEWLFGNILWVKSVNPEIGKKMMTEYQKINWEL